MVQEISFTGHSHKYCVCFVDMVESTKITATLDPEKMKRYYSIFINMMAAIARDNDANVIKNTGDSIIFYFPKTSDSTYLPAFNDVLECGFIMLGVDLIINEKLTEEGLPHLHYRISADYGRVDLAKSLTSTSEDIFGPTVNICAKINPIASPNCMVIGNDLYKIVKHTCDGKDYTFKRVGEYSIEDLELRYPVFSVMSMAKNNSRNKAIRMYKDIF
ncbi:MAG: adenylate/guanylate cyclase domain-containing protein [Nitrososphaeraceae archaeon]